MSTMRQYNFQMINSVGFVIKHMKKLFSVRKVTNYDIIVRKTMKISILKWIFPLLSPYKQATTRQ